MASINAIASMKRFHFVIIFSKYPWTESIFSIREIFLTEQKRKLRIFEANTLSKDAPTWSLGSFYFSSKENLFYLKYAQSQEQ